MDVIKRAEKRAVWDCHIWVDCPHCGEQQDLVENDGDWRLPDDLKLGEWGTSNTKDFITFCNKCGEDFVVIDLEW